MEWADVDDIGEGGMKCGPAINESLGAPLLLVSIVTLQVSCRNNHPLPAMLMLTAHQRNNYEERNRMYHELTT